MVTCCLFCRRKFAMKRKTPFELTCVFCCSCMGRIGVLNLVESALVEPGCPGVSSAPPVGGGRGPRFSWQSLRLDAVARDSVKPLQAGLGPLAM